MSDLMVRLVVFILIVVVLWIAMWLGQRFVEMRRRQALAAAPYIENASEISKAASDPTMDSKQARVRILAFQSEDCRQCHTLQTPALKRLLETCGDNVAVVEIDAPDAPELTERYRVLTLPTTVVLDASGNARAVNYGFTSTQRLLEQVNTVLDS
jgi:thioredoxin-like negative regulator of GroEL